MKERECCPAVKWVTLTAESFREREREIERDIQ